MGVIASALRFPIVPYTISGYHFGEAIRTKLILVARHLGDDIVADPGTEIYAIGDGVVVWSETRPGSPQAKNWGGIVIVEHEHHVTGQVFYSVYGHIADIALHDKDVVRAGDVIGKVASANSPENGYWDVAHLHFGIYTGPWTGTVLPGWLRPFQGRTKLSWWRDPKPFIEGYESKDT